MTIPHYPLLLSVLLNSDKHFHSTTTDPFACSGLLKCHTAPTAAKLIKQFNSKRLSQVGENDSCAPINEPIHQYLVSAVSHPEKGSRTAKTMGGSFCGHCAVSLPVPTDRPDDHRGDGQQVCA